MYITNVLFCWNRIPLLEDEDFSKTKYKIQIREWIIEILLKDTKEFKFIEILDSKFTFDNKIIIQSGQNRFVLSINFAVKYHRFDTQVMYYYDKKGGEGNEEFEISFCHLNVATSKLLSPLLFRANRTNDQTLAPSPFPRDTIKINYFQGSAKDTLKWITMNSLLLTILS